MWFVISLAIFFIIFIAFAFPVSIFLFIDGIKGYRNKKEQEKLNKLSKEGTQSTLRYFYGIEENEDEEK